MKTLFVNEDAMAKGFGEPDVIYVCRESRHFKLRCPCGCGHSMLLPYGDDNWALQENTDGTVTITPSIRCHGIKGHCKGCHIFITNSEIERCGDCPSLNGSMR